MPQRTTPGEPPPLPFEPLRGGGMPYPAPPGKKGMPIPVVPRDSRRNRSEGSVDLTVVFEAVLPDRYDDRPALVGPGQRRSRGETVALRSSNGRGLLGKRPESPREPRERHWRQFLD